MTIIGASAFTENKLKSITIPDSVTTLGQYAFMHNELTEITIGKGITTIEEGVFYMNELTSIIIPNHVEEIVGWAFMVNDNLTEIEIGEGVTIERASILGFYNKYHDNNKAGGVYKITWSHTTEGSEEGSTNGEITGGTVIPENELIWTNHNDGTGTITNYTGAGGADLIIPTTVDSLTVIGITGPNAWSGAFGNKNLTGTITIPVSVTSIGNSAFSSNE